MKASWHNKVSFHDPDHLFDNDQPVTYKAGHAWQTQPGNTKPKSTVWWKEGGKKERAKAQDSTCLFVWGGGNACWFLVGWLWSFFFFLEKAASLAWQVSDKPLCFAQTHWLNSIKKLSYLVYRIDLVLGIE